MPGAPGREEPAGLPRGEEPASPSPPREMRLTLRTLLAFRDEILEPADSLELGKKIRENEYPTSLMARIDTGLRSHADEEAIGRGDDSMPDANREAEYLDNVMELDDVAPFEMSVLESDAFLVELASCHSILATFLRKPAEVSQELAVRLRKRVYPMAH